MKDSVLVIVGSTTAPSKVSVAVFTYSDNFLWESMNLGWPPLRALSPLNGHGYLSYQWLCLHLLHLRSSEHMASGHVAGLRQGVGPPLDIYVPDTVAMQQTTQNIW